MARLRVPRSVLAGGLAAAALGACRDSTGSGGDDDSRFDHPDPPAAGVGVPRSGMLPAERIFMTQVQRADLTTGVARVPLFKGRHDGTRVWFVRMDVSDSTLAARHGLNFAPRLVHADLACPSCVQMVQSSDPVPGTAEVTFAGTVDFSPARVLVPTPGTGYPPRTAQPGALGMTGYSDLIRVQGQTAVWNAPIVATGDGPFDVVTHANTADRVMAIDTVAMTVDLLFVRAFAGGRDIFYFTFSSSSALSATIERVAFVPAMGGIPFANDDENPQSARVALWAFENGKTGPGLPASQGLNHVIVDGRNEEDAHLGNAAVLEALRLGGDARNVLGTFPTFTDDRLRRLYVPIWDVFLTDWRPEVVQRGENVAQTDGNVIRQLAVRDVVTNPGGRMLNSSNVVVNCPPFGFADVAPTGPLAPRPPGQP